jgi:hypothetical protein
MPLRQPRFRMGTQAIRMWAREADLGGKRSIGIITKPDTIPESGYLAHGNLIRTVGGKELQSSPTRGDGTGTETYGSGASASQ